MRSFVVALVLASLGGRLPTAVASPGPRAAHVDLVLRPSHEPPKTNAVDVKVPAEEPDAKGAYMGPIFLDGAFAKGLAKIPSKMRRGMGQPVGPEPMVFLRGGGAGLYARF